MILGNLDGVETGIRKLIRTVPLTTVAYETPGGPVNLPTLDEMARIQAYLIVRRNATRDFIDFVALAEKIQTRDGIIGVQRALASLDFLYPRENGSSVSLHLVAKQLSESTPHDLGNGDLGVYRLIANRWKSWEAITQAAQPYAVAVTLENQLKKS